MKKFKFGNQDIVAERSRIRSGSGGHIFNAISDEPITESQAAEIQAKLGYPPEGYDMYGFICMAGPAGNCIASWRCSHSCD